MRVLAGMADGSECARLRALAAEVERAFPLICRRTLLILADLDPDQLQAQWQVEPGLLALVKGGFPADLSGVGPRLRLLRVDAGDREVASLSLPNGRGDAGGVARFLVSGGLGVSYRAELGLASPEGGWLLLTRSNVATVPLQPREVGTTLMNSAEVGEVAGAGSGEGEGAGGEELTIPLDPTLADPGVPLTLVFPMPILPEAMAGQPIPGLATPRRIDRAEVDAFQAAVARGRFSPLPPLGILPLVIAREPPPPGQADGEGSGAGHTAGAFLGGGRAVATHPGTNGGLPWWEWVMRGKKEGEPYAGSPMVALAPSFPLGSHWLPLTTPGIPTSPAWPALSAATNAWTSRVTRMPTPVAPGWSPTDQP